MWQLDIFDPTGATLLRSLTNITATELDGGFRIGYAPTREALKLELSARNDLLGVPPRGVLRWTLDGAVRFHGVVPDPPSLADPNLGTVLALGGREALRVTLMDGAVYRNMGVYQIARDILARLCPPCLTYDPTLIGDGSGTDVGPTLDTFYSPTANLVTVLDALAKSAGVTWAADRLGRILFGHPSTLLIIPYQGSWRRLPVQGRETCTRTVLRVVSAPSTGVTSTTTLLNEESSVAYLPATVAVIAQHAQHDVYAASQSVEAPEGISLVRDSRVGTVTANQMDSAPAMDGDPNTNTTTTGPRPGMTIRNDTERVVGVRLRYRWTPVEGAIGTIAIQHVGPLDTATGTVPTVQSAVTWALPESGNTRDVVCIAPPSAEVLTAGWLMTIVQVYVISPDGATAPASFTIADLALLVVDEDAAQRVAESYLQVPFSTPVEIVLDGVYDPTDTVTITGTPDGDVTGPVASWELRHLPDGTRQTRIQLGATDESRTARAIKWAVKR